MQFVIDELPSLAVCCAGGIYGGMEGVPYPVAGVAVFFFLSLVLLYRFIYLCRIHYHIGIEQLVCEQGVFVRKVDYMELYRIVDFQEHQSLMQQLCGLKTVRIFSTDRNTPPARPYRHETEGRHRSAHPGTGGIQQTKKGNI